MKKIPVSIPFIDEKESNNVIKAHKTFKEI